MKRYGLDDSCTALPYVDAPGVCNRCGKALVGRQTQWCSTECNNSLARDHNWNVARRAARQRDGQRCVRCGESPKVRRRAEYLDPTQHYGARRLEMIGIEIVEPVRDRHGFAELVSVYEYREHLEVNHIVPRVGQGYGFGCHNHLDNLETLCHPCHVAETTRQGAERRLARKLDKPGTLFEVAP